MIALGMNHIQHPVETMIPLNSKLMMYAALVEALLHLVDLIHA